MNSPWKYLVLPFAWLYGLTVVIRNWLFDRNILSSKSFDIPIIGIGNLSAGGTGKTPMAEYLLKLLYSKGYKPALLSRGYGRKTSGYMELSTDTASGEGGDEPCQVKKKFPEITVVVCEDRVKGVETIRKDHPEVDIIVLDDCFQHRKIRPDFTILLTDYNNPYYADRLLPSGLLREPVSGKKRASVIIVTKCPPELGHEVKDKMIKKLKPVCKQPVYFTSIGYQSFKNALTGEPVDMEQIRGKKCILFTGIANSKPLERYLRELGLVYQSIKFPDHHSFSENDIKKIISNRSQDINAQSIILTTEKDWRRLEGTKEALLFSQLPLFFLPIEMQWNDMEQSEFDALILNYAGQN